MDQEQTPQQRARELASLLVPGWPPTTTQVLWAIRLAIVLGVLLAIGHTYDITLWDWTKLLIVPAAIAAAGVWFNKQQRERELRIAEQRAQDEALQSYLDQTSQLLADKDRPLGTLRGMSESEHDNAIRLIARARTFTVLTRLDGEPKGRVVRFLFEGGLLLGNPSPVLPWELDLSRADLRNARLAGINLTRADLSDANLSGANLGGALLNNANLSGADLSDAYIEGAEFDSADFRGAKLLGAAFGGAHHERWDYSELGQWKAEYWIYFGIDYEMSGLVGKPLAFKGADLSGADLSGAAIDAARTRELAAQTKSLAGATMPNGQKYEDWLKSRGEENSGTS